MKKKNLIFVLFAVAILGVGVVSAFGFGNGKMIGLDENERGEMQAFHQSLENAIESGDYTAWKNLMESQITEDYFERMQERQAEMGQHRVEMREAFENGETPKGQGYGMHGRMNGQGIENFGECPFANSE